MSIQSTSFNRKKTSNSILSQSDNFSYSRHSLNDHQQRSQSVNRIMSGSEEASDDILTDLSALPYMPYQQVNNKRNRRFSELKPNLSQQIQGTNSDRRSSLNQLNFSSLLPHPFRSHKHHHKNITKDETNTNLYSSDHYSTLYSNDTMTMKSEPLSSLKLSRTPTNDSRTNLSVSNDRLSSIASEDSASSSSSLFTLDTRLPEPRSAETLFLKLQTPLCVGELYREHFFEYFHTNYCGEFEIEGPFIASLRCFTTKPSITDNTSTATDTNSNCQARAIIRIPNCNHDVSVTVDGTNEDNILQVLFNKAHLSAIHTCKTVGDPKANEKIYLFDKSSDERQNCKIGLIYQGSDQTNEYDIFKNDLIPNDLLDFLQILADRVNLKGFNKYRGDLDIKDDLHGEYSYYTQYQNHEIMFNIAPLIPTTKANGQCIERKGLVGNAFVCIVFQETDVEFVPDFISGKVTHVYITVQPITIDELPYYKINIWHRNDVTSIIEPPGGLYQCDESFRDYFLTLLLNSINVAIESPKLRYRIIEQRQRLKHEELRKLSQTLLVGQVLDTTNDVENNTCYVKQRSDSRAENTLTSSTTETFTPTIDRTSPLPAKKRTFSKIFGVFTGRSGSVTSASTSSSLSTYPSLPNTDTLTVNPPSPELTSTQSRTTVPSDKAPIKRASSVKFRPAPPPPIPPRTPIQQTKSITSIQSSTLPLTSSQSNIYNDKIVKQYSTPGQTFPSNTNAPEETTHRSRSNSSPSDSTNTTTKLLSLTGSRISEEIDDTSSSIDDNFDDALSEDEKIEHRQTLTEPPLLLPSVPNS